MAACMYSVLRVLPPGHGSEQSEVFAPLPLAGIAARARWWHTSLQQTCRVLTRRSQRDTGAEGRLGRNQVKEAAAWAAWGGQQALQLALPVLAVFGGSCADSPGPNASNSLSRPPFTLASAEATHPAHQGTMAAQHREQLAIPAGFPTGSLFGRAGRHISEVKAHSGVSRIEIDTVALTINLWGPSAASVAAAAAVYRRLFDNAAAHATFDRVLPAEAIILLGTALESPTCFSPVPPGGEA